jgi:magnesium-transporting ATPase (P-type)
MDDMTEPLLGFMAAKPPSERNIKLFAANKNENLDGKEVVKEVFAENIIVSSRYTPWNFLPKSLLEQFRRLANVYFLVIGMIAVVASYTSYFETAVEPAGILGPMIIVVLISVIKDGVEDVKRHNQDAKINAQIAHRADEVTGAVTDCTWRDLQVGDTIVLFGDEEVPADVVVLACGGVQGAAAYVETAAIDGETNLKLKNPCLVTGALLALYYAIVSQ